MSKGTDSWFSHLKEGVFCVGSSIGGIPVGVTSVRACCVRWENSHIDPSPDSDTELNTEGDLGREYCVW